MIGLTDEEKVKAIERLKILTGNNDEKLIGVLIDEAEAFVLLPGLKKLCAILL